MRGILCIFTIFIALSALLAATYEKDRDGRVVQVLTTDELTAYKNALQTAINTQESNKKDYEAKIVYLQGLIADAETEKARLQTELNGLNNAEATLLEAVPVP